jgi:hypothetical protein
MLNWNDFYNLNENLDKGKSILKGLKIPETNDDFLKLRKLLSRNTGYIGKFTEWLFVNKIPYNRLEDLYKTIKQNSLSKPIDQYKNPEQIIDEIVRSNADTSVNQIIKAIPSRTREEIKEGDEEGWKKFLAFLKVNANNKDKIIDFLSKKGGRYGDYDDYDVIDTMIDDIKKFLDFPSYEKISADSKKKDKDIGFIFENDKYLIISTNYDGIKKYGSSYWCITEDESTFDDYNDEGIQLIVYFKDKNPFDEKSIMGISLSIEDIDFVANAAHWEDDTECLRDGRSLLNIAKKDPQFILNVITSIDRFGREEDDYGYGHVPVKTRIVMNPEMLNIIIDRIGDYSKYVEDILKYSEDDRHRNDENISKCLNILISKSKENNKSLTISDFDNFASLSHFQLSDENVNHVVVSNSSKIKKDSRSFLHHIMDDIDLSDLSRVNPFFNSLLNNKIMSVKQIIDSGVGYVKLLLYLSGKCSMSDAKDDLIEAMSYGMNLDLGINEEEFIRWMIDNDEIKTESGAFFDKICKTITKDEVSKMEKEFFGEFVKHTKQINVSNINRIIPMLSDSNAIKYAKSILSIPKDFEKLFNINITRKSEDEIKELNRIDQEKKDKIEQERKAKKATNVVPSRPQHRRRDR